MADHILALFDIVEAHLQLGYQPPDHWQLADSAMHNKPMRTDPTDNGGLFVGRRPGTAPVKYRRLKPGEGRKGDRVLAVVMAGAMALLSAIMVLALPVGALYLVAQIPYLAERPFLALSIAFIGILLGAMLILSALAKLDRAWVLVRRSGGVEQDKGIMTVMICTGVFLAGAGFMLFLIFGGGLAATPMGPQLP